MPESYILKYCFSICLWLIGCHFLNLLRGMVRNILIRLTWSLFFSLSNYREHFICLLDFTRVKICFQANWPSFVDRLCLAPAPFLCTQRYSTFIEQNYFSYLKKLYKVSSLYKIDSTKMSCRVVCGLMFVSETHPLQVCTFQGFLAFLSLYFLNSLSYMGCRLW